MSWSTIGKTTIISSSVSLIVFEKVTSLVLIYGASTGLTYEALTGKNKQSVPDCERLINPGVIAFLERKGDVSGAHVLKLFHNWHKAVDGRGLSEDQRSEFCNDLKEWILADWMPWFRTIPDYSTIDVNR